LVHVQRAGRRLSNHLLGNPFARIEGVKLVNRVSGPPAPEIPDHTISHRVVTGAPKKVIDKGMTRRCQGNDNKYHWKSNSVFHFLAPFKDAGFWVSVHKRLWSFSHPVVRLHQGRHKESEEQWRKHGGIDDLSLHPDRAYGYLNPDELLHLILQGSIKYVNVGDRIFR
jgi:hypothetical protein